MCMTKLDVNLDLSYITNNVHYYCYIMCAMLCVPCYGCHVARVIICHVGVIVL